MLNVIRVVIYRYYKILLNNNEKIKKFAYQNKKKRCKYLNLNVYNFWGECLKTSLKKMK